MSDLKKALLDSMDKNKSYIDFNIKLQAEAREHKKTIEKLQKERDYLYHNLVFLKGMTTTHEKEAIEAELDIRLREFHLPVPTTELRDDAKGML